MEKQFGLLSYLSSDGSVVAIGATENDGNGAGCHTRIYQWDSASSVAISMEKPLMMKAAFQSPSQATEASLPSVPLKRWQRHKIGPYAHLQVEWQRGSTRTTMEKPPTANLSSLGASMRVYKWNGSAWSDGEAVDDSSGYSAMATSLITRIYQWDSASSSWNQLGNDIDETLRSAA